VKGTPKRDSRPKVSSGKLTPISLIAVCTEEKPEKNMIKVKEITLEANQCDVQDGSMKMDVSCTHEPVMDPIQPVQPMLAKG
jgi:hypothetical protein